MKKQKILVVDDDSSMKLAVAESMEICGYDVRAADNGADALAAVEEMGVHFNAIEAKSALRAGEMQRRHRQRSGESRPIADFLVGAHALLQCDGLITFDTAFHRDYFKGLKLIVPANE